MKHKKTLFFAALAAGCLFAPFRAEAEFQFVISVRQRLQGKSSVRSERSPAQFDVLPVEQTPFHFTGIP